MKKWQGTRVGGTRKEETQEMEDVIEDFMCKGSLYANNLCFHIFGSYKGEISCIERIHTQIVRIGTYQYLLLKFRCILVRRN